MNDKTMTERVDETMADLMRRIAPLPTMFDADTPFPNITPSPDCVKLFCGNDWTSRGRVFHEGDAMLVDMAAVPKAGDLVAVLGDNPFCRWCDIPPAERAPRDEMVMMTEDDGEFHEIRLGRGGRKFGVVVAVNHQGKATPPSTRRKRAPRENAKGRSR